jgi:hypothetical protein
MHYIIMIKIPNWKESVYNLRLECLAMNNIIEDHSCEASVAAWGVTANIDPRFRPGAGEIQIDEAHRQH